MKLILAVVPENKSPAILDMLTAAEFRATVISATGGVLRKGSSTLLLGIDDHQVDAVLKQIQIACMLLLPRADPHTSYATVFVLAVQERLSL